MVSVSQGGSRQGESDGFQIMERDKQRSDGGRRRWEGGAYRGMGRGWKGAGGQEPGTCGSLGGSSDWSLGGGREGEREGGGGSPLLGRRFIGRSEGCGELPHL